MAASSGGLGYWLVAADGGIFTFGDAPFSGSAGSDSLGHSVVAVAPGTTAGSYWEADADGGIPNFG